MSYIDLGAVRGYVIDASALIFERKDGHNFLLKNATGGSVSTDKQNITISNGWISSPMAIVDTTSEDTIQYTTNLTDMWLIAGMNNLTMAKGSNTVTTGDNYEAQAVTGSATDASFDIAGTPSNIKIEGMEELTGENPVLAAGKFTVTQTASVGDTPAFATVKFLKSEIPVGSIVPVVYTITNADSYAITFPTTDQPSPTGKLTRITPIYAEEDDASSISAYIYDTFTKVKVSAVPGFDNGYKSESSHTIEFKSMTPTAVNAFKRKIVLAAV